MVNRLHQQRNSSPRAAHPTLSGHRSPITGHRAAGTPSPVSRLLPPCAKGASNHHSPVTARSASRLSSPASRLFLPAPQAQLVTRHRAPGAFPHSPFTARSAPASCLSSLASRLSSLVTAQALVPSPVTRHSSLVTARSASPRQRRHHPNNSLGKRR